MGSRLEKRKPRKNPVNTVHTTTKSIHVNTQLDEYLSMVASSRIKKLEFNVLDDTKEYKMYHNL